jgi:hypothetical protein
LGFKGVSANWLPGEALDTALDDGVLLNAYLSYNVSRWNNARYFSSLDEINTTEFYAGASRCANYPPMNEDLDAKDYLRHFPGDAEGVESYTDVNGITKMRGKCKDGVWWLSPACRADRSKCIPWISVAGYGYSIMWHKATYFNMAIAMASTNDWVNVIYNNRVTNYAWIPDASFSKRPGGLEQLLFPPFVKEEHADHFYITEFAQVETEKWAHRDLEKAAPRIWVTASRMNMTSSMMQGLLEHASDNQLTGEEGACYFLRTYRDWWQHWVPSTTDCQVGEGLFTNEEGEYECQWCPRATASVVGVVPETDVPTRFCQPCMPGRYQSNTQASECLPCAPGTKTDVNGSEVCERCSQGTFQPLEGSTQCTECPQGRITKVESAEIMAECVCVRDTYEPLGVHCRYSNDTCACEPCMLGLDCELGSSLEAWVAEIATGVEQSKTTPQVMPGYYSLPEDPVSIYKCQEEEACGGGAACQLHWGSNFTHMHPLPWRVLPRY